jgi:hypothetical protein
MAIRAGQPILALDFAGNASDFDQTDEPVTDAANYQPGTAVVAVTFMAPTSGAVKLHYSARMRIGNTTAQRILALPETREGDIPGVGDLAALFSEDLAIELGGPTANLQLNASNFQVVTGLVPGAAYNTRLLHKIGAANGTGTIFARSLSVTPMHL